MKRTEAAAPLGGPVVRLMGGMGNQMFQYALGRRIEEESGARVRFDLESGFRRDAYRRQFALGEFNVRVTGAERREVPMGMGWPSPWHALARVGWAAVPRVWRRVIYERNPFAFDPNALDRSVSKAYLFGYWQNERYFRTIGDRIRQEFTLRIELPDAAKGMAKEMSQCRSVSVHVRRNLGVGANGSVIRKAQEFHGLCGTEYYQAAMDAVGCDPDTVYYVFTDDITWAREHIRAAAPLRNVTEICRSSDGVELTLMASCQHHIIANSSFSWWGAWLGKNTQKLVVAPRTWAKGPAPASIDICPKEWMRV